MKKSTGLRDSAADDEMYRSMYDSLTATQNAGIDIYVDERRETPGKAAYLTMMVKENHYQCLYRTDETGKITVHFIREKEEPGKPSAAADEGTDKRPGGSDGTVK